VTGDVVPDWVDWSAFHRFRAGILVLVLFSGKKYFENLKT
jgi:hypothetical protein